MCVLVSKNFTHEKLKSLFNRCEPGNVKWACKACKHSKDGLTAAEFWGALGRRARCEAVIRMGRSAWDCEGEAAASVGQRRYCSAHFAF